MLYCIFILHRLCQFIYKYKEKDLLFILTGTFIQFLSCDALQTLQVERKLMSTFCEAILFRVLSVPDKDVKHINCH